MAFSTHSFANSLKTKLILYMSFFSLIVGCVLMMSAYKISLEETNEILDQQMKNLAERVVRHGLEPTKNDFEPTQRYAEQDLFVDVWYYKDRIQNQKHSDILLHSVPKAGFYRHKNADDVWYTYVLPQKDYQIQVSQHERTRQVLALELAGSMVLPYILIMPFVLFIIFWMYEYNQYGHRWRRP